MIQHHISILADEWLDLLKDRRLTTYVDCTLGAGGHAERVLETHPEIEEFIGIDQDKEALEIASERLKRWKGKTAFIHENFSRLKTILGEKKADAIFFDLGVSSMQLDQPERGFSFSKEGPLDMRMDEESPFSAETIVNTWSEEELGRIFRDYGEEKQWKKAARAIVKARDKKPLRSTIDLVDVLQPALFKHKKKGINPMTLIFQALRICVNSELEVIRNTLPFSVGCLNPGGIVGVISFHSLEDRIVKLTFRDEASTKQSTSGLAGLFAEKQARLKILTKKPIVPSEEEIERNPRSRSAKMRAAEKK